MPVIIDGTNGITQAGEFNSDSSFGFKNRLINGQMVLDQRNAGASVTPTDGQFTLDRWRTAVSQSSKFSIQQNAGSVTPPAGFTNYLGATSLATTSLGASDYYLISQPIEGFNTADLNWGTANAKTVTFSFWVRSSLTGTFGGAVNNSSYNRSYPFSYTISTANTWEQKSVTIAGDTSGTWVGATNGIGMQVFFSLGMGSTFSGTAGAWAGSNFLSATGATSVVGTNGATFYITGVQLEVGSTATNFDFRSIGTELALCQRYYQNVYATFRGYAVAGQNVWVSANLFCPLRATPTVTATGTFEFRSNISSVSATSANNSSVVMSIVVAGATGETYSTQNLLTCSAEL